MPDSPINPAYLSPIATSAAIAVTMVLWVLNMNNKDLSYEILSDTPLLSSDDEVHKELEILFHGEPVQGVHLVLVKIVNTGNVPIRSADFEGKLKITLDKAARVLMAEVQETQPANLQERGTSQTMDGPLIESVNGNAVYLRPVLLNGKDFIIVKLLASHSGASVSVNGHIEGIREIKLARDNNMLPIFLANVGSFTMAVSLFFLDPHSLFENDILGYLPYLLFFLCGYVMLLSGVYYPTISKRGQKKAPCL